MRRLLVPLALVPLACIASCSFLLDFDSLQKGGPPDASVGTAGGGGSAGSGGSGGSGGIPLSDFAPALATALCADLSACYVSALELIVHDEDCVDLFTKVLTDTTTATIQSSLSPGPLSYDPQQAAACVAGLTAAAQQTPPSCQAAGAMIEGCKSAVKGAKASGGACNNSYECQAGSYCKLDSCPGVCTTYPQLGANCSSTEPCDPTKGLYCEPLAADAGADAGTCQAFVAVGADCTRKNSQCVPGAVCLGKAANQKCQLLTDVFTLNAGQTCYENYLLCNPGLSCEFQGLPLVPPAACVAEKATTDACKLAMPSECPKGSYCTASLLNTGGQCVGTPTENQACAMGTEQSAGLSAPCAAGLTCVNGICKSRKSIGQACETNGQCYGGVCSLSDGGMSCVMPGCAK